MAVKISRVLVILANPFVESDQRNNLVNDLCKTFLDALKETQIEVDYLDLYSDLEFSSYSHLEPKSTKIIEYQIRIKKAQIIIFFHQLYWFSVPALLKNFIDRVFVSGFAYRTINGVSEGLLDDKRALVISLSEKPNWQVKYIYGNIIENFWKKAFLEFCGIKSNRIYLLGNFRSVTDEVIDKWHQKMQEIVSRFNTNQNFLEYF
jgi:NAD(P)H dehydrogenase (quinone)